MHLSVLIPARSAAFDLQKTVATLHAFLSQRLPSSFEIILIPNGPNDHALAATQAAALFLARTFSSIKVIFHDNPKGRSAALRTGYAEASGEWIALCHADLPFGVEAFAAALPHLTSKLDLITANRRLAASSMMAPAHLLARLARCQRDRANFNSLAQKILPLGSSDTQAGLKFLSRRLAATVFAVQSCHDFLFDLEIFMVAQTHGYGQMDLPVRCLHRRPRSGARSVLKAARSAWGLTKLAWRFSRGRYKPQLDFRHVHEQAQTKIAFSADDWGLTPGVNEGILRLAQDGVVKRVSILANADHVNHGLKDLLAVPGVEVGLHFNLTLGSPTPEELREGPFKWLCDKEGRFLRLRPQLMNLVLAKTLSQMGIRARWFTKRAAVFAEIDQAFAGQFRKLKDMGIPLSYFDGHHHIHLAPFVLASMKRAVFESRVRQTRLLLDPALLYSTKFILYAFSRLAAPHLKGMGLEALSCVYPRLSQMRSPRALLKMMKGRDERCEIITHPALRGDLTILGINDTYDGARVPEYLALARFGRPGPLAVLERAAL